MMARARSSSSEDIGYSDCTVLSIIDYGALKKYFRESVYSPLPRRNKLSFHDLLYYYATIYMPLLETYHVGKEFAELDRRLLYILSFVGRNYYLKKKHTCDYSLLFEGEVQS